MTIEERIYIERTEGYSEGIEIGRKEELTRFINRLRELGVPEEIIKAALSEQAE